MKHITSICDLEQFGIVPLTGEADKLMFRILCDVTKRGAKIIAEAFGLNNDMAFLPSWNSKSRGGEHVGSILLAESSIIQIAVIAGVMNGYTTIVTKDDRVHMLESGEELQIDSDDWYKLLMNGKTFIWNHYYGEIRNVFRPDKSSEGLRNQHQISGRTN